MMTWTRKKLVPFVLCATGLMLSVLTGCRKEETASQPPAEPQSAEEPSANAPVVYMNDPAFRQQVADKRKELQAVVNERAALVERMEALIKEHGQDLAVLQKIDEWNDLHKKVVALNEKYEEVRKRQLKIVAGRIAPGKDGKAEEAVPATKEISK